MEFKTGDRVWVVSYPDGWKQFAGVVTSVNDESDVHELGFGCECAYDIQPDGQTETRRVLAAYVTAPRGCEACGVEIREPADCHEEDHRKNVCRKCDSDFAHVWPKGTLA